MWTLDLQAHKVIFVLVNHRSENFGGTQRTEGQESGEKGEGGVV